MFEDDSGPPADAEPGEGSPPLRGGPTASSTAAIDREATLPIVPAGAALAPGYLAIALLSRGYDLDVYDVWSEQRRCRCVAKVLRPDRHHARSVRQRLAREAELLLRLSHPHIVRAYEYRTQPAPLLILETLTGATLAHLLDERPTPLRTLDLIFLGHQLCAALGYLHQAGVLHLDLKPSNIIISGQVAKLIDLSIAQPPGAGRRGVGTAQYMAPEQVSGGPLSAATDVWGLGLTLFEMATGRRPWVARRPTGALPSVRSFRRLPAPLAMAIDRCLAIDAAARPSIAALADLCECLAPAGAITGLVTPLAADHRPA